MAGFPLTVISIPVFDVALGASELYTLQMGGSDPLCLRFGFGIDLKLCSKREHSEDDIGG